MDQIVLNHVTKQFTTKTLGTVTAVNDFNLTIKEGECFSFLGPSGCGKTTTLRMIAGFEDLGDGVGQGAQAEVRARQHQEQKPVCAAGGARAGHGVPIVRGMAAHEHL